MKPVSQDQFRRACGRFATGVAVAGVRDAAGVPHGLTVNSFASVSLVPPLALICVDHKASAFLHFRRAATFGISVLRHSQRHLSERFARHGEDRFMGVAWRPAPGGAPLLCDAVCAIECRPVNTVTAGDHDIFIGEVIYAEVGEGEPLIFFASRYRGLASV